jgi:hypothetical protein
MQIVEARDTSATERRPAGRLPGKAAALRPAEARFVRPAAFDRLLPHWRGLADRAFVANPFMAPEFIEPAAAHLAARDELLLAAIFRPHALSEELIGLFALSQKQPRGLALLRAPTASLWTHPLFPDGTPLLSADPNDAKTAVTAFLDAVSAGGRHILMFPAMPVASPVVELIAGAAAVRGLQPRLGETITHTRGLDIMLSRPPAASHVTIAREPAPVQAMLEQALALDAARSRLPGEPAAALFDQRQLSFLRAAARGFSHTRQIVMARFCDGQRKAAAAALLAPGMAYMWRLFGAAAHDPSVEAALATAISTATERQVVAATTEPVAGICMPPFRTATLSLAEGRQRALNLWSI